MKCRNLALIGVITTQLFACNTPTHLPLWEYSTLGIGELVDMSPVSEALALSRSAPGSSLDAVDRNQAIDDMMANMTAFTLNFDDNLTTQLNALGLEGWELVQLVFGEGIEGLLSGTVHFKRQL
jgi:hypothetical protein